MKFSAAPYGIADTPDQVFALRKGTFYELFEPGEKYGRKWEHYRAHAFQGGVAPRRSYLARLRRKRARRAPHGRTGRPYTLGQSDGTFHARLHARGIHRPSHRRVPRRRAGD